MASFASPGFGPGFAQGAAVGGNVVRNRLLSAQLEESKAKDERARQLANRKFVAVNFETTLKGIQEAAAAGQDTRNIIATLSRPAVILGIAAGIGIPVDTVRERLFQAGGFTPEAAGLAAGTQAEAAAPGLGRAAGAEALAAAPGVGRAALAEATGGGAEAEGLIAAARPFNLGPGETRFQGGEEIASVPAIPDSDALALINTAKSLPPGAERDAVLAELSQVTDREIRQTEDGRFALGPRRKTAGQAQEAEERLATIDSVLAELDVIDTSGATEGTGGASNLQALIDATAGQLSGALGGPEQFFPDNAANRQKLRLFSQLAKRAIINNPRFPVAEQNIVKALLPTPEAFFKNPAEAAANLLELRAFLQRKRARDAGGSPETGAIPTFEVRDGRLVPVQ